MSSNRVVLAEYFTTDDLILLFLVRKDFTEPEVVEIKKPLKEIQDFVIAHFREERDAKGNAVMTSSDKIRALNESAYQEFFEPFVAPLVAQSHKGDYMTDEGDIIWLVPHDVLHYLPLHALKVEGRYLIERNPICYTPSASVMEYCHAKRKGRRSNALVLGDSLGDRIHARKEALIHAREEAMMVARLFGTTPYIHRQANKTLLKDKISKERDTIDILHLACHGYFNSSQALKSGIKLAPENGNDEDETNQEQWNLTAEEIFALELRADLVTLSACESGVNKHRPGDELIGLTRALLYAGTPSVVVSLWQVNSLSTQILMEQFYTMLKAGAMKADALQQAQTTLMTMPYEQVCDYIEKQRQALDIGRIEGKEAILNNLATSLLGLEDAKPEDALDESWCPFIHPYYWAPFILVGDWK